MRNSTTQVSIFCCGKFSTSAWDADELPEISGSSHVPCSMRPTRVLLTEMVTTTFESASCPDVKQSLEIESCGDLALIEASQDGRNHLVPAGYRLGLPGQALAKDQRASHIVGWPLVRGGVALSARFVIEPTVLYRIKPPQGFDIADLASIEIKARLVLWGLLE